MTILDHVALNAEITKQAIVVAYANHFKLKMIVVLLAAPPIFLLKRARRRLATQ